MSRIPRSRHPGLSALLAGTALATLLVLPALAAPPGTSLPDTAARIAANEAATAPLAPARTMSASATRIAFAVDAPVAGAVAPPSIMPGLVASDTEAPTALPVYYGEWGPPRDAWGRPLPPPPPPRWHRYRDYGWRGYDRPPPPPPVYYAPPPPPPPFYGPPHWRY